MPTVVRSRTRKPAAPVPLYTLEVRLTDGPVEEAFWEANPDIARIIQIKGDQTLHHLHLAIFKAFDRVEEHLYEFEVGGDCADDPVGRRFELFDPDEDEGDPLEDTAAARLDSLGLTVGDTFYYWFDFGDDWRHDITVTAIAPKAPKGRFPKVVGRVGASPSQDSIYAEEKEDDGNAEIIPMFTVSSAEAGKMIPAESLSIPDRRAMEQHTLAIQQLCDSDEYESLEEAQEAINKKLSRGYQPVWEPRTPVERAQAKMYDAFAAKGKKRIKLAREALAISPDCADAYVLLAEEEAKTLEDSLAFYEQGVRAGERALGAGYIEENEGMFWGLVETRPYMRALAGLADCLVESDRTREAVIHWQAMLRLNPNDNQGVRDPLLNALLEQGDDTGARLLLKQYEKDYSANWMWSRFLLIFRSQGPGKKAETAFRKAMECNPYVPLYMMGLKRMPKYVPDMYEPAGQDEAVIYVTESARVWLNNPVALAWMVDRVARMVEEDPSSLPPDTGM